HLGMKNAKPGLSDTLAWLKVFFALFFAFNPRLQITRRWLFETFLQPIKKYPLASSIAAISIGLFGKINRFGDLPDNILSKFGFFGDAPFHEWIYRTV